MEYASFRKYSLYSQLVLVLIFFLVNFLENQPYYPLFDAIIYALNYTFMIVAACLVHYIYVLPLYLRGDRWLYLISALVTMTFFVGLYYLIDYLLPFPFEEDYGESWLGSIIYDYLLLLLVMAYTSLYYFVEKWFKSITTESQLRAEKLQAELNFLKSQINPHFLFNTLNNIYSYVQTGNEKSAPMLERLSSILRFMVYDGGENRVELLKEVAAIEDLLEIHKMKNSRQDSIRLSVEGIKGFHLIAPLILVNFVENACKHSDVISNSKGYLRVSISVNSSDRCTFRITNSYREKPIDNTPYQGLGLSNMRKRLELQYQGNYALTEQRADGQYELQLEVPLERKQ